MNTMAAIDTLREALREQRRKDMAKTVNGKGAFTVRQKYLDLDAKLTAVARAVLPMYRGV
jgi:hypothetical protein